MQCPNCGGMAYWYWADDGAGQSGEYIECPDCGWWTLDQPEDD